MLCVMLCFLKNDPFPMHTLTPAILAHNTVLDHTFGAKHGTHSVKKRYPFGWWVSISFGIGTVSGAVGIMGGGDAGAGPSVGSVATAPGATHATAGETDAIGLEGRRKTV